MSTVTGRLTYDNARSNSDTSGIANVPMVLQDTSTGQAVAVLTDTNGNYTINNVPAGSNYQVVEYYGYTPAPTSTTADWSNATIQPVITTGGKFPPISYVTNPPPTATRLDAVTSTTMKFSVPSTGTATVNTVRNGPVADLPIGGALDSHITVDPNNLITGLDKGTFGTAPAGSGVNTGAGATAPYSDINSTFQYTQIQPADGQYSIQNIMDVPSSWTWRNFADHTTGNETGRYMAVGGSNPNQNVLEQTISVQPNTNFMFSTWISNMNKKTGLVLPSLAVQILGANKEVIYNHTMGSQGKSLEATPNNPTWVQVGDILNSGNNTSLTIRLVSLGGAAAGNDFAVDDIKLNQVTLPPSPKPDKTPSSNNAKIGDTITYTTVLKNPYDRTMTNAYFQDTMPNGLTFTQGSVKINGAACSTCDPTTSKGVPLPDIPGGGSVTVTFDAKITSLPNPNPATNYGKFTYDYNYIADNTPTSQSTTGDGSTVTVIETADVTTTKVSDKTDYLPNQPITYTITVVNNGPSTAKTPTVSDRIPSAVQNPQYSLDNGTTWATWNGSTILPDIAANAKSTVLIKGTVGPTATGSFTNTATVSTPTPKPDGSNTPVTSTTTTNVTPTSDLVTTITPDKENPIPGDNLTYTVTVRNSGPSAAATPKLSYTPPPELTNVKISNDGGNTWTPWTGSKMIDDIPNGGTAQVLIRGKIDNTATGTVTSTITATSPNNDPTPANNTATTTTPVKNVADVTATKVADKAAAKPGEVLTYTITVFNNGPAAAESPTVGDRLRNAIETPQYSLDNGATWAPWNNSTVLPNIAPGTKANVLVKGMISTATPPGEITNTATVTTPTLGKDGTNTPVTSTRASTNVTPVSDLVTTITPDKDNPVPGDDITYLITVKNNGPATAVTPEVNFNPPRGLTAMEVSTDGGNTWTPWTGTAQVPSIPNGGTEMLLVRGRVDGDTANVTSSVTTRSVTPDSNTSNNTSTANTSIQGTADITATKTADKFSAAPGSPITYTINIINNGPSTAKTPTVTDQVPTAVENPQYSTDSGATWTPWTGSADLPDITANTRATMLIRGTIRPNATGSLINRASVTTPTPGTDGTNTPVTTPPAATMITPNSDLVTTITTDNNNPKPGDELTYTVTIKNNGPITAPESMLRYTPPANLTDVEYSMDGGRIWYTWTGNTTLDDIPNGGTDQVLIRGRVTDGATGTIRSTMTAVSPNNDPVPDNNTATVNPPIQETAGINVTKTADKSSVKPNDTLNYTITVSNSGPGSAKSPTVYDQMPAGLENPQYSLDGATWAPWTGNIVLSDIAAGTNAITCTCSLCNKTIANTAAVTTPTQGTDGVSTPVTSTPTSTEVTPVSDLVTTINVDNNTPKQGDTVIYTINVKNNGPSTATEPKVDFTPPKSLTGIEYSNDGGKTWTPWTGTTTLNNIPDGGTSQILVRGKIGGDNPDLTSSVTTRSLTDDPNPGNNTANITANITTPVDNTSDIVTSVTVDNNTPKPGDNLTYTVTVKNNGPAAATTPRVSYTPPPQLTNVEYSNDGGKTWTPWTGNTTLDNIPNGGTKNLVIRGRVSDTLTGNITTTITTTPVNTDPNMSNNTSVVVTQITNTANISLTKSADKAAAKPGETITYTINVTNSGPVTAKTPTINDSVPAAVGNPQYSLDNGVTWTSWTGSTVLPDISANTNSIVLIRGTVSQTATGSIANTASVTTPTPGPGGRNTPVTSPAATTNITNVTPVSNLVTTVTVDNTTPKPGDEVTYTVKVKNNGSATAITPTVTYRPPRGLTDVQYSNDGGKTWTPWTGTTTISNIPNGESNQFLLKGKIDGSTAGTITTSVTVTSPSDDPANSNNTGTADVAVSGTSYCTVRFCSKNCLVACQNVPCGMPVPIPENPCNYGCDFAGWFMDCQGRIPWNFEDPVTSDMILYARWRHNRRPRYFRC